MDRSIPRHDARRPFAITRGKIVYADGKWLLFDKRGNRYSLDYVSIATSAFGKAEDGTMRLPRPEVRLQDAVVVDGDELIITFLDGNYQLPIIIGTARSFKANTQSIAAFYTAADPIANELRGRMRFLDSTTGDAGVKGKPIPELRWLLNASPGGSAQLQLTGAVTVSKVTQVSTPEPVPRGKTFLTDLQSSLTEIQAAFASLGVPLPNTSTLLSNIATSLSKGAPYLSTTLDTE